jgi:hypothetical protein
MANKKKVQENTENKVENNDTVKEVKAVKETVKKRKEIDMKELVLCRSVTSGLLTYRSQRTGFEVVWNDYSEEQWIPVEELIAMKASKPMFLTTPWFIIENDDVIDYLGLRNIYNNIIDVDDLENFFRLPMSEISEKLKKVPKGFKETIASRSARMIADGTLFNIQIIKILEEELKINLQILI